MLFRQNSCRKSQKGVYLHRVKISKRCKTWKFRNRDYANLGGLVKKLGCQIATSFSHLLHLCDETVEARQQFFDERSGKPITS